MSESYSTRFMRWYFNFFPAYRGTGGRVTYIASDWREVRVKVPLNWRTRNYVGTIFGGSMYGAVDPIYMLMLMKILGPDYIVWDKAAAIQFKKPGRGALQAHFQIDQNEIDSILEELEESSSIDRIYEINLVDEQGKICATIDKTVFIKKTKNSYST